MTKKLSKCTLLVRSPSTAYYLLREDFKTIRGAKSAEAKLRWLFDQKPRYRSVILSEHDDVLSFRDKGEEWRDAPKRR